MRQFLEEVGLGVIIGVCIWLAASWVLAWVLILWPALYLVLTAMYLRPGRYWAAIGLAVLGFTLHVITMHYGPDLYLSPVWRDDRGYLLLVGLTEVVVTFVVSRDIVRLESKPANASQTANGSH